MSTQENSKHETWATANWLFFFFFFNL